MLDTFTLEIPPGSPQEVPALTIALFPSGLDFAAPDEVGTVNASQYTPAQSPVITGPLRTRLVWSVACLLTEEETLRLFALRRWQQRRYLAGEAGELRWTDEINLVDPEPAAQVARDLLNSRALDFGMVTGHPRVACLLDGLQRSLAGVRRGSAGEVYYSCTFVVSEIR